MISRRVFVGALGLAALAAPARAEAQRAGRPSRIAFLGAESPSTSQQFLAAFREGLRARGYVEGRDVVVEAFWAEGRATGSRISSPRSSGRSPTSSWS